MSLPKSVSVEISLVNGTSPMTTFTTLQNIYSQLLYASTFDVKFNGLTALLDLFTLEQDS